MPVSGEVWACVSPGDRAGDIDQVDAIAWALDPRCRRVDLAAEFARLQAADALLPRAIVGIGRKRIAMARAIRERSGGTTKLIHIGRDRGCLADLDCLITTPAFPAARSPKVLTLDVALSDRIRRWSADGASAVADGLRATLSRQGIDSPWINVFLGNPPAGDASAGDAPAQAARVRTLARQLDRLAAQCGSGLVISGSPRTAPELYDILAAELACPHHLYRWTAGDPGNPFDAMLSGSDRTVVTADSVTMISQLVAAGHRVLVFPWRARDRGAVGRLRRIVMRGPARRGKDLAAFSAALYARRLAAPCDAPAGFEAVTPQPDIQDRLFQRVRDFLS